MGNKYLKNLKKVKEWSVGTYGVLENDYDGFKKGFIDVIERIENVIIWFKDFRSYHTKDKTYCGAIFKWFPTLEKAEEYSNQLLGKDDKFVLPEKWCIRVTNENKDVLAKWRVDGAFNNSKIGENYIVSLYNDKIGWNFISKDLVPSEFIENERFPKSFIIFGLSSNSVFTRLANFKACVPVSEIRIIYFCFFQQI